MSESSPNFDRVARVYRWLEYASLGPLLERTRGCYLERLRNCSRALVLGDGDGRFTARLLEIAPRVQVQAIDLSCTMLALLRQRCARYGDRLQTLQQDARSFTPRNVPDLVATHFFLDCLTQADVESLVARLSPQLAPQALWVVSEFRVPRGMMRWPARLFVRSLYLVFRLLTALRPTRLPNHAAALKRNGFTLIAEERRLLGMLTSQLWQRETLTNRRQFP